MTNYYPSLSPVWLRLLRSVGALLLVLLFGACRQEQPESPPSSVDATTTTLRVALEASTEKLPYQMDQGARAFSYSLGTQTNITAPKLIDDDDEETFLCLFRLNDGETYAFSYMKWKRDADGKYYIKQEDGHSPLTLVNGSLPMVSTVRRAELMVVAGGLNPAGGLRYLDFTSSIAPVEVDDEGNLTAKLEVPYATNGWFDLAVEDPNPQSLRVRLASSRNLLSDFRLEPLGSLLLMTVENEMLSQNARGTITRDLTLSKLYIRSNLYRTGSFEIDVSGLNHRLNYKPVSSGSNYWFPFNGEYEQDEFASRNGEMTLSTLTLPTPLRIPYSSNRVLYNKVGLDGRSFYRYPGSPMLVCWVKAVESIDPTNVRTEIFAEVEDEGRAAGAVYSNAPGVDRAEAEDWKTVVPSMKALPVYASQEAPPVQRAGSASQGLERGKCYPMTLNLQRQPMILDLLSEEAVSISGNDFDSGDYSRVAYMKVSDITQDPGRQFGLMRAQLGNTNWEYPLFSQLATIMGVANIASSAKTEITASTRVMPPSGRTREQIPLIEGIGNYQAEPRYSVRAGQAFSVEKNAAGNIIVHQLLFYPAKSGGPSLTTNPTLLNADHLSIVRYEYDGVHAGVPRMKMTQRYLGSYSLLAGYISSDFSPSASKNGGSSQAVLRGRLGDQMMKEFKAIVARGDSYWNDPIQKQDDVVRYFPLLGYKTTDGTLMAYGQEGYISMGYQDIGLNRQGHARFSTTLLQHAPHGGSDFSAGRIAVPIRLVRSGFY